MSISIPQLQIRPHHTRPRILSAPPKADWAQHHTTMDRLSRFRRHKKDIAGPATAKAGDAKPAASRTPSPSGRSLAAPPQLPREKHSRSPFRGLHLRSSAKRARESPQPQSPTTTATSLKDALKRQTESPIDRDSASQNGELQSGDGKPKMPQFLSLPQAGSSVCIFASKNPPSSL